MLPALDVGCAVTHGGQEIVVGSEDVPCQIKFDHRHGPVDCGQTCFLVLLLQHLLGDVGRQFDDSQNLSIAVQDGVVAGLQPNRLGILAQALEAPGNVFALAQALPEFFVLR